MRLTCKRVNQILIGYKMTNRIYKGHNQLIDRPETRIDLKGLDKQTRMNIRACLREHGIVMYQDSPLYNPFDYILTY